MLVLITKPPYGFEDAFAGLRLGLAMAVNGLKTSVLMIGDGVFNAVGTQRPEALKMPSNIDATKELYDFEAAVYVVREDLEARNIAPSMLFEGLRTVSQAEARELAARHDVVTTF